MKPNVGLTVVITLALALPGLALAQGARTAIVSDVHGSTVEVRLNGGQWQRAEIGMVLNEMDEIRTKKGSSAEILIDEERNTAKVELKENSHLRFSSLALAQETQDEVTRLDLAVGRVLVHARELRGDSLFEVKTPNGLTGVRGTVFEVRANKAE